MPARSHPRRLIVALVTGGVLLLGSLAGWSGSARAAGTAFSPSSCVTTPSTVVPGVQIADPACEFNGAAYTAPFSPIANGSGQLSRVWTGIAADGASYRVEVPPNWNGTLVMFAHGYRGTGNVVWIDDPQLRQYFVDNGFAWAASSYAMNGYDPGDGVVDTHDLLQAFPAITGLHVPAGDHERPVDGRRGHNGGDRGLQGRLRGRHALLRGAGGQQPVRLLPGRQRHGSGPHRDDDQLPDDAGGRPGVRARVPVHGGDRAARPRDYPRPGHRRADVHHQPDQDRDAVVRHRRAVVRRYPSWFRQRHGLLGQFRVRSAHPGPVPVRRLPRDSTAAPLASPTAAWPATSTLSTRSATTR